MWEVRIQKEIPYSVFEVLDNISRQPFILDGTVEMSESLLVEKADAAEGDIIQATDILS